MWKISLVMAVALASCTLEPPAAEDLDESKLAAADDDLFAPECAAETCEVAPEQTLAQCIAACEGGAESIRQFCLTIADARVRAGCFALMLGSEVACINWCYLYYGP